jgi:hypothetical protein
LSGFQCSLCQYVRDATKLRSTVFLGELFERDVAEKEIGRSPIFRNRKPGPQPIKLFVTAIGRVEWEIPGLQTLRTFSPKTGISDRSPERRESSPSTSPRLLLMRRQSLGRSREVPR